jgi:hypothetical protein
MRVPWLGAPGVVAVLARPACGRELPTPRRERQGPTIVLVTIESLRADAALPEALQGLAASGRTFTDAGSASPMARPPWRSMLSGVAPDGPGFATTSSTASRPRRADRRETS